MGKQVTLPSELLLNSDQAELISAEFKWGVENTCIVTYKILTSDGSQTYRELNFTIEGADFSALVNGYGATMESRLETDIWQDIQDKFDLVP